MALKLFDRVQETSTTTGTGDFTLAGAITGFSTFASRYSTGDTLYYGIHAVDANGIPSGEWEIGIGTYSAANTLTRTTVLSSSNSDSAVSFSAGNKRAFVTMTALQGSFIREKLTAARTYYVRTDGSDSNAGLANTSGGAFLTIQKAIDIISSSLDIGNYDVLIKVADGTYTGAVNLRPVLAGTGTVKIEGNTSAMSNVIINPTSATCFTGVNAGFEWTLAYMKLTTTTSGNGAYAGPNTRIFFNNIDFGACPGSAHLRAEQGGLIECKGNYSITGSASYHHVAAPLSEIRITGAYTITLTGTPAFTTYAYCNFGFLHFSSITYSGSATGKRYDVSENGLIKTYGGGASYLPGGTSGTTATGGQYT